VKIIQDYGARTSEMGILHGARAQIKNQEPEPDFTLKFRNGAGAMVIWEVAPAPGNFLDTNSFAKESYVCSL